MLTVCISPICPKPNEFAFWIQAGKWYLLKPPAKRRANSRQTFPAVLDLGSKALDPYHGPLNEIDHPFTYLRDIYCHVHFILRQNEQPLFPSPQKRSSRSCSCARNGGTRFAIHSDEVRAGHSLRA